MIWLGIGLGYVVLAIVITVLIWRLFKIDADLFSARRQAALAEAKQAGAQQQLRAAEERCRRAQWAAETSLGQTGQALEIAGHIKLVSQQLHALVEYITDPYRGTARVPAQTGPPRAVRRSVIVQWRRPPCHYCRAHGGVYPVILALYAIGSTTVVIVLVIWLRVTHEKLWELQRERSAYIRIVEAVEEWVRSSDADMAG